MQAITLPDIGRVTVSDLPEPKVEQPTDAIVRLRSSAICGSDLHVFHGHMGGMDAGYPIGHEYVGIVEEVGAQVRGFRPGMRVGGSFFSSCGHCDACRRRQFSQCQSVQLFGFGPHFGNLAGTQAELIRIPNADYTLFALPDEVSDAQGLFLGDALTTAYFGVKRADIQPGMTVAVVGCGPVGQLAIECAQVFGAARVIALDLVPDRLAQAEAIGAIPVTAGDAAAKRVRSITGGQGADAVVEAVGSEATLRLAFQIAAGFATISSLGVFSEPMLPVFIGRAFAKDLTLRAGMANIQAEAPAVLELLRHGRLHPERLVTHQLPLREASQAYGLFDRREALKVMLVADGA